ncbi:MAG: oligoendopeptidase F [Spirochaetales bacterium]|nr:oligoendopeptidase F [Candidatus Physcosoma equi]
MKMPMRSEVKTEDTWDLSLIYKTVEDMEKDVERMKTLTKETVALYKGRLTDSDTINKAVDAYQEILRLVTLTTNYTDLAVSVDYYNSENQTRNDSVSMVASSLMSELSFLESEISELPDAVIKEAAQKSTSNRCWLLDLLRKKPHRLSPETEKAMAALSPVFRTPYAIYNMAKLADMKFPSFTVDGKEYPLGYSLYEDDYAYEANTAVRREAFRVFSEKLKDYENATAAAYNAQVQQEKTIATLRGYDSVFDYLLSSQKVSRELYDRQIDTIMKELAPHMRRYAKVLQKVYGLEKMTYADLKLEPDPDYAPVVTKEKCREFVTKGLSILGEDYVSMVEDAFDQRWFDWAVNQGKSTGGFCASPYGKNSYILLSFTGRMSDIFTVAHELGHAGHFKRANSAQSIVDTDVSSYFVEAPSTMNELLMASYLMKSNDDPRFHRWVYSIMVSNTYYHNFVTHLLEAAYQREVYRLVDKGESVQAETLSAIMKKVLTEFWGDAVELTEGAELTWMRQPHYYMGLYSYTYSAGLTVATQVSKRIQKEGTPAVEDWKKVLFAGSTLDPQGLSLLGGVDISTDAPLRDTIETIGSYITELEKGL